MKKSFTINHISKYKRGSNQHIKKTRGFAFKGYKEVLAILLFLIPVIYFGNMAEGQKEGKFVSPLPADANTRIYIPVTGVPTPTIEVQVEPHDAITEEINQVFGNDAPKAFKLLSCENHALNPNAVNTAGNFPVGSRDIGVFQINEYWQKVNATFLFNPDINIRIAYQIYKDDGSSFHMWTCGRKLGI
jgi:hypothetical protein